MLLGQGRHLPCHARRAEVYPVEVLPSVARGLADLGAGEIVMPRD